MRSGLFPPQIGCRVANLDWSHRFLPGFRLSGHFHELICFFGSCFPVTARDIGFAGEHSMSDAVILRFGSFELHSRAQGAAPQWRLQNCFLSP